MRKLRAKLLVVGAGGVGSELLKNLALTGFSELTVFDLDAIDVSNLNRQFLFKRKHVGMPKADIACEEIRNISTAPEPNYVSHCANIRHRQFDIDFFKQFDLVLNALDNKEARRHVNRLCKMAKCPLIDSGSTGFNGQVVPIVAGLTECYECTPVPRTKSFPVCTIRSFPEKPEHCIAWSKHLLEAFFFFTAEESLLSDYVEEVLKNYRTEFKETKSPEEVHSSTELKALIVNKPQVFCNFLFVYVFEIEIERLKDNLLLRDGEDASFVTGKAPIPLKVESNDLKSEAGSGVSDQTLQTSWDIETCINKFFTSVKNLSVRITKGESIKFDKDDDDTMDFVAAAANLRMTNFHINRKSRFGIQEIAGSIIPAVASTNAIVAGVQASMALNFFDWMEAFPKWKEQIGTADVDIETLAKHNVKFVWVKQHALGRFVVLPQPLSRPNPKCYVCQDSSVDIVLRCSKVKILEFVKDVIIDELGFSEPLIEVSDGADSKCVYDPEEEEDIEISMEDLNVKPETTTMFSITDLSQGSVHSTVVVRLNPNLSEEEYPRGFAVDQRNLNQSRKRNSPEEPFDKGLDKRPKLATPPIDQDTKEITIIDEDGDPDNADDVVEIL